MTSGGGRVDVRGSGVRDMRSPSDVLQTGGCKRSPGEEFVSALTHGVGMALSVVAVFTLLSDVIAHGNFIFSVGCCFYGASLIAVYAASTMSHTYLCMKWNRVFRALDQGLIYLLIVGTLTPFALKFLSTPAWICFYLVVLAIGFVGFFSKTVFAHRLDKVSVWIYVALGWGAAISYIPMLGLLPLVGLYWVVAGGLCYSVGTIFLVLDKQRYYFHVIWHLFVIAGSTCHYVAILRFVVPDL